MNTMNTKILLVLLLASAFFIAACVQQNPEQSKSAVVSKQNAEITTKQQQQENMVLVAHDSFTPRELKISKGGTVAWKNTVSFQGLPYSQHTITSGVVDRTCSQGKPGVLKNSGCGLADGIFNVAAGSFSFTFNKEGAYTYYIAEHPTLAGIGTVIVAAENAAEVKEFKVQAPHAGYTFYSDGKPIEKVSVKQGDKLRFLATSDLLAHSHGITIDDYGINEVIKVEDESKPKVIEFVASKAGTFKIYCKTCLTGIFGPHPWMEAELEVTT